MGRATDADGAFRIELIRKAIHLCSLAIPAVYLLSSRWVALSIFAPITALCIALDITRHYHPLVEGWFYRAWGRLLRDHEVDRRKKRLNGATYVMISATLCILIFPKVVAVTSFSILIISDLCAALVGKRFGRRKFFSKTLEGSFAFFLSGVLVVMATPKVEYRPVEFLIGFAGAAAGALVEARSIAVDDNLSIPLAAGALMWLLYSILLPGVELFPQA